jgi:glycosyltransferase involved in cell wall biosynthesis
MKTPLVSIIINNFNYGQFLAQAINSALFQTYKPIEVIVVDDGSSDNSRDIIADYGYRVHPILKANGGQASTFNAGFAASRGEIVIFLDADDALFPETVSRVVAAWCKGLSKLQYRLQVCNRVGKPLGLHPAPSKRLDQGCVWPLLLQQGNYTTPVTSGNAFSRAALAQILPMPEADYRIAADGYLNTVITFLGPIAALEEPLGLYRMHGQNLWASGQGIHVDRLRKFVRHDLQRFALILEWGQKKGQALAHLKPQDLGLKDVAHLKYRLLSLRLNPQQHPLPKDTGWMLVKSGLWAIWSQGQISWLERLRFSAWFFWVGFLPLLLVRPLLNERRLTPLKVFRALGQWGAQLLTHIKPMLQRV